MNLTSNFQTITFKLFSLILACSVLLWFSLFSYGLLYYLYIPAIAHVKPVHLLYDTTCLKGQQCKNPYANVSLTKNNEHELLTRGQVYTIELVLDMPESERNINQGMFMIRLEMLSEEGHILQSSRRPVLLRYRTPLFKVIYTLFFIPALLAGTMEEKQTLTVSLFEQFVEYKPTYCVYVEIEAQAAEIYSSFLKIHAQFTGLRYMMYYWPILSMIIGVGSNFFFMTTIAVFIWIRHAMNSSQVTNLQRLDVREQDSMQEIRRAIQEKQLESQGISNMGIQRNVDFPDVETVSPHDSESREESLKIEDPSLKSEKSLSDISGIRRRTPVLPLPGSKKS